MNNMTVWEGLLSIGIAVLSIAVGLYLLKWLSKSSYINMMDNYYDEGQPLHAFGCAMALAASGLTVVALGFVGTCGLLFGLLIFIGEI